MTMQTKKNLVHPFKHVLLLFAKGKSWPFCLHNYVEINIKKRCARHV